MPGTLWLTLFACRAPEPARDGTDATGVLWTEATDVVFAPLHIGTDAPASRQVWIQNAGSGPLSVMAPRIEGDDAFGVTGDAVALEPSESYAYAIVFDPQTPFSHEAVLILEPDASGSTRSEVALRGEGVAPVIEVATSTVEMGLVHVGCTVLTKVGVRNTGNETLEVAPSILGSPELALADGSAGVPIAPGDEESIELAYEPVDGKGDAATLVLDSSDPIRPLTEIEVTGAGAFAPTHSDWFEGLLPSTDVIFVVDNSQSMSEELPELMDSIDTFVDSLAASGVDYRIGVITSDTPKFEGAVVTSGTTDPATVLADQIADLGTGSARARTLEMLYDCIHPGWDCSESERFLRPEALLDVIVVADGPDLSALRPSEYVEYLWTLKSDPGLVSVNAIAGSFPPTCSTCDSTGYGYDEAVELADGTYLDICGDWDENLELLGSSAVSPGPFRFALSETPAVDTIEVLLDGSPAGGGTWTYVVNAIEFDLAAFPPPGTAIEVRYTVVPDCP